MINGGFLFCILGVSDTAEDAELARAILHEVSHQAITWIIHGPGVEQPALKNMTSQPCNDGDQVLAGKVYLAAPGVQISLKDGAFAVQTGEHKQGPIAAADALLQSAAKEFGERAISVVLPDDTLPSLLGREAIGRKGGIVVQIGDQSDGTGLADIVADRPHLMEMLQDYAAQLAKPAASHSVLGQQELREVCEVLRKHTGHDFKHYKESTLSRRIMRRMNVLRSADVDDYLRFISDTPDEARMLMRDLLIGVTAFFRDKTAFVALREKTLKPLLMREGSPPLRIWVPGCGRGHEPYSIAMMVRELQDELGVSGEVQIFATDLDERALRIARKGFYAAQIASDVSPERLERFFDRSGQGYRVRPELRQAVVFSPHNLIGDPPFSRLDLVSCRNLMIYLGPHLQKKLMSVFHYALDAGGYLFLGSSEAVTGHTDLFRAVDSRHRIAQRKETALRNAKVARPDGQASQNSWQPLIADQSADLGAISQRILLDEFAPSYAIVNEDAQIIYLSQGASNFLQQPEGQYVNHIMRMARDGLRVGLRTAWTKATKNRRTAIYEGLTVEGADGNRRIKIVVQPMPELGEDHVNYMVVFQDLGAVQATETGTIIPADSERLVEQLEAELLHTREELERSVQDLEAANEEMKSSNEELLSMNEELQSANEELESSKEEVEAGNRALSASNDDLKNLLYSTGIATLFLDADGRVRNFTPALTELYNIRESDIGRPVDHFTHHFKDLPPLPDPTTVKDIEELLEDEVVLKDDQVFLRRVTPYRTHDGQIDGTVVTFVNITDQKRISADLAAAVTEIETHYKHAPVGLGLIDRDLQFVRVNDHLAEINGMPAAEHIGQSIHEVVPDLAPEAEGIFKSIFETGNVVGPFELSGETKADPGNQRTWLETFVPVKNEQGEVYAISVSTLEITEQKKNAGFMAENEARLRRVMDGVLAFVGTLSPDGVLTEANEPAIAASGLPREDILDKPFWDTFWWSHSKAIQDQLRQAVAKAACGETVRYDTEIRIVGGDLINIDFQLAPVYDSDDVLIEITASCIDISARKRFEQNLVESEEKLQLALLSADQGVFNYIVARDEIDWDEKTRKLFDAPMDQDFFTIDDMVTMIHPDDHPYVIPALHASLDPAGDGSYRVEHRINTRDGSTRWVAVHGLTSFDGEGADRHAVRTTGTIRDVTARKLAEEGYARSLERLELALDVGRMGIWDWDLATNAVEWTDGVYILGGLDSNKVQPTFEVWRQMVHPEDRERAVNAVLKARDTRSPIVDRYRLVHPDGTIIPVMIRGMFFYDADGSPVRMLGVVENISELAQSDAHRELLLGELNHRVKNSLATIQAMASHTMRTTPDPAEFHEKFKGRLRAISLAHEILSQRDQKLAGLADLIERQVGPYVDIESDRISLSGPNLLLGPNSAHALGLVLHELATNATKYGALSTTNGSIDLNWRVFDNNGAEFLELKWAEIGGPEVIVPETRGFGSRLIQQSLEYSFNGSANLNFNPEGLEAVLSLPVRADYDE